MEDRENVIKDIEKSPAVATLYIKDGIVRAVLTGDKRYIKKMVESVNEYLKEEDSPLKFNPIGEA